jgi:hypothetical protein
MSASVLYLSGFLKCDGALAVDNRVKCEGCTSAIRESPSADDAIELWFFRPVMISRTSTP